MDNLTKNDVEHLAKLSYLDLSEEEKELFLDQLNKTIIYVEKINELNTSEILPTSQTTKLKNITRKDEVKQSLTQEQALSNAKKTHKGYFVTKSVF